MTRFLHRSAALAVLAALFIAAAAADPSASPTRTYGGVSATDVEAGPLSVVIQGRDTDIVTTSERDIPRGVAVSCDVEAGTLKVSVAVDPSVSATTGVPGSIVLTVPRYEFVTVENGAGDISIDNLSTEKLAVTTTSGAITITNTNAALTATSSSGSETFKEILGVVRAQSDSGDIELDDEAGLAALSTRGGSIRVRGIALQGATSFATTTGSISVSFQYGLAGLRFELSSTTGNLSVGTVAGTQSLDVGSGIVVTGTSTTGSQSYQ